MPKITDLQIVRALKNTNGGTAQIDGTTLGGGVQAEALVLGDIHDYEGNPTNLLISNM